MPFMPVTFFFHSISLLYSNPLSSENAEEPNYIMGLDAFLRTPGFLHDREAMLMHKLIYDCRLALAEKECRLQVLTGEVDHDGYDVVFDDGDYRKQFQVKVVYSGITTWSLHRRLFRPTPDLADWFAFESSPEGIGIDGGFILQELDISPSNELIVKYHYTDLFVLRAFDFGLISTDKPEKDEVVRALFYDLKKGHGNIDIPKTALVPVKNATDLLDLAGFVMSNSSLWRGWLKNVSGLHGWVSDKDIKMPGDEAFTKNLIRQALATLRAP
jgi:hypothetical protein